MTTTTVKQRTTNTEVTKPVRKGTELDLEKTLADMWNSGQPNGILNPY